jgi:predicted nucleotidyltransferase
VASPPTLTGALAAIRDDLDRVGARFALVGGLAVSARAEPRLTRDVDLAVAVFDDAMAEDLVKRLTGYRVTATLEQTTTGRIATVRLRPPGEVSVVVDLLFASCGIEPEIVAAAETLEILPSLRVPVARTAHLIAMKLLARDDRERPQDLDDIRALLTTATAAERRAVLTAIRLIAKRGYARGRDLEAAWRGVARSPR